MTTQAKRPVTHRLKRLLVDKRWFRGKARKVDSADIIDRVPFSGVEEHGSIALARVAYADGGFETYVLYLREERKGRTVTWIDCVGEPVAHECLRALLTRRTVLQGAPGYISAESTPAVQQDLTPSADPLAARLLGVEQSNTSLAFGDLYVLKLYRAVEPGAHPDLEVTRFLTSQGFANAPPLFGSITYRSASGDETALGILQGFVRNQGDGWKQALGSIQEGIARVAGTGIASPRLPSPLRWLELARSEPPGEAVEMLGDYAGWSRLLGRRTAELHRALAADAASPAFAPEPFTEAARKALHASIEGLASRAFESLKARGAKLKGRTRELARRVLSLEAKIQPWLESFPGTGVSSSLIRCHGDFHLGQVLFTGSDFFITDFEGEVSRPLAERRGKSSPLRDVAGMMRSFHYASCAATADLKAAERERLGPWAELWRTWAFALFLGSYLDSVGTASFFPKSDEEIEALLRAHWIEKALYELDYELNNRPDWVAIPLDGVLGIVTV